MPKIHSIIDINNDDCREGFKMPKEKSIKKSSKHEDLVEIPIERNKDNEPHKYKSEVKSDKNKLFHHVQTGNQNVNVTVRVEQPSENCLTSCFEGLSKCFKRGS